MRSLSFSLCLVLCLSAAARGAPAVVTSAVQSAAGEGDSGWRLGAMVGAQSVVFLGQPERYDLQLDGAFRLERYEVVLKTAGLTSNPYGTLTLRRQVLDAASSGVDFSVEVFSGIPSWSGVLLGAGAAVGRSYRYGGWTAGLQAGLGASPYPNQRPGGPNAILALTLAGWLRPLSFLELNLEAAVSPFLSTLLPGVTFDPSGLAIPAALQGWRLSIFAPMNIVHAPAYEWEHPDGTMRPGPGVTRFTALRPGFRLSYGQSF